MDDELENVINLLNDTSFKKHFSSSGKKNSKEKQEARQYASASKGDPNTASPRPPDFPQQRKRPQPFNLNMEIRRDSSQNQQQSSGFNTNDEMQGEDQDGAYEDLSQPIQAYQEDKYEQVPEPEIMGRGIITKPRRYGKLPPQFPKNSKAYPISEKQLQKREKILKRLENAYVSNEEHSSKKTELKLPNLNERPGMMSNSDYSQSVRERKTKVGKLGLITSPFASGAGDSDSTFPTSTQHASDVQILAGSHFKHTPSTVTHAGLSGESGLSVPEPRDPPAVMNRVIKKYLKFRPYVDPISIRPYRPPDRKYYFKFNNSNVQLIRYTLQDNGFREATGSGANAQEWALMWSCGTMKSQIYQQMNRYQKINHFPRSYEITRKDLMYQNLARMQSIHGERHFPFIPKTFILPQQYGQLSEQMQRHKRTKFWIVKPAGSSQGKGIYFINCINDIPHQQLSNITGGHYIVSHYIANPLLVNDYKFDLRIYVGITSINPLRIYIFEDGLCRFATCKYQGGSVAALMKNKYMHLTNYSINKKNANFVNNVDAKLDDYGSKWSVLAIRRHLRQKMGIDDNAIWAKIEDIIVKTLISVEPQLNSAYEMFVPFPNNCFEVLGFDVLIDQNLDVWLLEVNLSPSMNCDSPLDQNIKGNLIADLFTLTGVVQHQNRSMPERGRKVNGMQFCAYAGDLNFPGRKKGSQSQNVFANPSQLVRRQDKMSELENNFDLNLERHMVKKENNFSKYQRQVIKETEDEFKRKGKFKRIFPTSLYQYYKQFFQEERPINALLCSRLRKRHDRIQFSREIAQLGIEEKMVLSSSIIPPKGPVGVGALILRSKSRHGRPQRSGGAYDHSSQPPLGSKTLSSHNRDNSESEEDALSAGKNIMSFRVQSGKVGALKKIASERSISPRRGKQKC